MKQTVNYIKRLVPCFHIKDCNVKILQNPEDFYNYLKDRTNSSNKRIVLASLYLGIGEKESKLIESITDSIQRNNNQGIRVNVLLDHNRGSRPVKVNHDIKSSRTMCIPILKASNNNENIRISFYHTPNLRGIVEGMLPHRINEVIGLQHMKIYIVDDCLIMSGANLSNDYFTNRQDRYIVFEDSRDLCDYYEQLVQVVSGHCYQMTVNNDLVGPTNNVDPITGDYQSYVNAFKESIQTFLNDQMIKSYQREFQRSNVSSTSSQPIFDEFNTVLVFPLVQMGLYGIEQDTDIQNIFFRSLLDHQKAIDENNNFQASSDYHSIAKLSMEISIASGYFNLDPETEKLLLELTRSGHGRIKLDVLTAAPESNGFFKSPGISYYIPELYCAITKEFVSKTKHLPVHLYEWIRPKWTFHSKGIWLSTKANIETSSDISNETRKGRVSATFVGSTNYGYRSRYRDLESELVVYSRSDRIQHSLQLERDRLFSEGHETPKSRLINYWINWIAPVIRWYL